MEHATEDLRPLNAGEAFDTALAVYRQSFATMLRLAAAVLGPFALLEFLVVLSLVPTGDEQVSAGAVWAAVLSLTVILLAASGALAALATHAVLQRVLHDRSVTARESARVAIHRPGFVAVALLVAVCTTAGYLACALPGLALWVTWSLATPAYVAEPVGVWRSLGRSRAMLRRRWWAALVVYLGCLLPWTGIAYVVALVAIILAAIAHAGPVGVALALSLGTAAALVVLAPVLACVSIVFYLDGRVRNDGLDLVLALQTVRTAAASAATSPASTGAPRAPGIAPPPTGTPSAWGRTAP